MEGVTRIYGDFTGILIDIMRKIATFDRLSAYERGYILLLPMLTGTILESIIEKQIYYERTFNNRKDLLEMLHNDMQNDTIMKYIHEIFLVRDCIIHNHLYLFDVSSEGRIYGQKISGHEGMIQKYADAKLRRTKRLHISIIPDAFSISDCIRLMGAYKKIIQAFHKKFSPKFGALFSNYLSNHVFLGGFKKYTQLGVEIERFIQIDTASVSE